MPLEGSTPSYSDVGSKGDIWWMCVVRFAYGSSLPNIIFFWLGLIVGRHESVQRHRTRKTVFVIQQKRARNKYLVVTHVLSCKYHTS